MELLLNLLKWSMIAGAAALALTLLKPLLDKRYRVKWRYGAWLVMAVFLLLAPVPWGSAVPQAPVTPAVVIEVPKVEISVSREEGVSFQRPEAAKRPVVHAPAADGTAKTAVRSKTFPLEELLITLWITGGALFLLYHTLGTRYFTRRALRWSRSADEETIRVYNAVCRDMGLKRPPALRISSAVDSPMMVGLFRARLLLPNEDFEELELTFILRHELTHHRRHDLWYKLFLMLANALHWFNPLIYLMRREAERDLELTCDDAVVAGSGVEMRRAYSETLLASVHRQKGVGRAVLSTHFYGGKEVMKERFRNILGKRGRKRGVVVLAVVLVAIVAAACTFGLQTSDDGELSAEELAEWQEKLEAPEMAHYIRRMYSDISHLPSEEKLDEMFPVPPGVDRLGYEDVNPIVLSGTKSGGTVTLEIEGNFLSRLPTGTLTLVDGEPVSFTNPLYTAVEAAALDIMENTAAAYIGESNAYKNGGLEFTEQYISNRFCSETMEFDEKTYQVWELFYFMKPNDIDNVFIAGGMYDVNGWVTDPSIGSPIIISSVDADGNVAVEDQTYDYVAWEDGYTWEEYIYCHLVLGMDNLAPMLNGWPEFSAEFITSLRNGHETWAYDWQDVALSYLSTVYDVYPDSGLASLRPSFQAGEDLYSHTSSMVVQGTCGERTVTLFLAAYTYNMTPDDPNGALYYSLWQVAGDKWEPDAPEPPTETDTPAEPKPGELTADELAAFTSYFDDVQHNGLLRFPYNNLGDVKPYLEMLFYDMGGGPLDPEEKQELLDTYFDGDDPDCDSGRLPREFVILYLYENIAEGNGDTSWLGPVADGTDPGSLGIPYLEQYDSYYWVHGDTMMSGYTFDRGEWDEDGRVHLYYTANQWQYDDDGELGILWEQPMCATMAPHPDGGEGWIMISNQIVE